MTRSIGTRWLFLAAMLSLASIASAQTKQIVRVTRADSGNGVSYVTTVTRETCGAADSIQVRSTVALRSKKIGSPWTGYSSTSVGGTLPAWNCKVTPTPAPTSELAAVAIDPQTVTLAPGGVWPFTGRATWMTGATTDSTVTAGFTFAATGGTITAGGLYTAGAAAGSFRVVATYRTGRADTAAVTITAPPAPSLTGVLVAPPSVSLLTGAQQQFTATGTYSDGSSKALVAAWQASGGTINTGGLYSAGALAGAFNVIGSDPASGKADTSTVTLIAPQPPPPPGPAPAGYDPARLGPQLVAGTSWLALTAGFDSGYTSLNQYGFPGAPGQVALEADPVFTQVVRWAQPAYRNNPAGWSSTLQHRVTFAAPVTRFWYRAVVRLDGNGNPLGFTSYGTGAVGGSTTWKMLFAYPVGTKNRMQFELLNGGDLLLGAGQAGDNVTVETRLPQGGAPTVPLGGRISISRVSDGVANDLLRSRDWFELVINFEQVSATRYLQRYFVRQLTTNGGTVWAPRAAPSWSGWQQDVTSGAIAPYNLIHLGGNKSQTNDGPNHQFVRWGPWEVTTAQDPYGWDRYGK